MSSLVEFAERELRALPGRRDSERIMLERDVVALVALFDAELGSKLTRCKGGTSAALGSILKKDGTGDYASPI